MELVGDMSHQLLTQTVQSVRGFLDYHVSDLSMFRFVLGIFTHMVLFSWTLCPYSSMYFALLYHDMQYTGTDISHGLACGPSGSWAPCSISVQRIGVLQTWYQSLRFNRVLGSLKAASSRVFYMRVLCTTHMCRRLWDVFRIVSLLSCLRLCYSKVF